MDINSVRGLSSIMVLLAFTGICWWAFSPRRRKQFEEAANLPFADEPPVNEGDSNASSNKQKQGEL